MVTPVSNSQDSSNSSPRWWPLSTLLVLFVFASFTIWFISDYHNKQKQVMHTAYLIIACYLFCFLWALFFSRFNKKIRFYLFITGITSPLVFFIFFKIEGTSGDFVPEIVWRWTIQSHDHKNDIIEQHIQPLEPHENWLQFLGNHRNGSATLNHFRPLKITDKPKLIWRRKIGSAWSGFAISNGKAITQEQHRNEEWVSCYDLSTGELLWKSTSNAKYQTKLGGLGPRATPTIHDRMVFSMGATGTVKCNQLKDGKLLWSKMVVKSGTPLPDWGNSCSPLVYKNKVIVFTSTPDRSVLALDKYTGEKIWSSGSDNQGYSSPQLYLESQILNFNNDGLSAHHVETGVPLWRFPWARSHPHCASPLILPDKRIFISSGYGTGGACLNVILETGKWICESEWRNRNLKAKFNNPIYFQGHIYGLDDGVLSCIDTQKGERKWKKGRMGHGQIIRVGNKLLVTSEYGSVHIFLATPEKQKELLKFQVFEEKTWNPPALASPYLVLRNHKEAACFVYSNE